ncbi:MAG: hypothetical protein PVH03_02610, partial [Chloroflexota bacterium]|jgi:hypothetical protein
LPAAAAAIGQVDVLGLEYWQAWGRLKQQPGVGMSQVVLSSIAETSPWICQLLFEPGSPRFLIAASAVDAEGAIETQSKRGRRRGRLLLLAAARGDRSWVDDHLTSHVFDTGSKDESRRLTAENFAEVAYASSRMLHAWDVPATVAGRPYVDAFYTNACPALELAELGYPTILALANEPIHYRDIFHDEMMPPSWAGAKIKIIAPDEDPAGEGVDYTCATEEGLVRVFNHGLEKGKAFLA